MKKLILLLSLSALFAFNAQAQKVPFMGEVRDSLGIPLEFANVMALDTVKNTMAGFGVTNNLGQFKIFLDEGKPYRLKVSFIGYLPFEAVVTAKDNSNAPLSITLNNDAKQLGDFEVVSEMPVLIQGDTITYKADAFTQGNERKLGDVLKDLPGFEVNDDGQVSVQGKRVDKVLVEGKEFFEGDSKLATQNLPANVVDRVQVLQRFNDISPLGNVNQSDALALNIQLKEDKKSMVFGDVTLGGGPQDRYFGHVNAFYYSPKTSINFIGDANNVGKQAFTFRDYFRFAGGLSSFASRSGSSLTIRSDELGIPMAERNTAQALENSLGALNFTRSSASKKWNFSGFAIGSKMDNTLGSVSLRNYILQTGGNQELLTSTSNVQGKSGLLKFGAKFTPNPELQVDYNAFLKLSDTDNRSVQNSEFNGINNQIGNSTTQQPWSLQHQLRAFYAQNDRNVFSFEGSFEYKEQDPLFDLMTSQRPFAALIPLTNGSPYNLLQFSETITQKQEAAINYYRILNKTNHINLSLGNVYTTQELTTRMAQRQGGNELEINDPQLNNLVDYNFQDYYVGLTYKTKLGKLIFTPSLTLHNYRIKNTQLGVTEALDKTLLLPSVNANYELSGSQSISLNYGVQAQFTDVQNVARGLIVRSYNSLFGGNPALENSLYHALNLNYRNFNMYNFFNIYGGVNYQKRFDQITNVIDFSGLERVNTPVNIDAANEVLSGNLSGSKQFDDFSINASTTMSRSTSNNLISDIANENISIQQTYRGSVSTRFFKALNIDIGYEKSFNEYKGLNTASEFTNEKPFVNLDISFLKDFRLDVDYEYNNYENKANGTQSDFEILDVELSFRSGQSAWEFKMEGMNLLNTTGVRRDSFNESLISTYEYFIQKRYWLFTITRDL